MHLKTIFPRTVGSKFYFSCKAKAKKKLFKLLKIFLDCNYSWEGLTVRHQSRGPPQLNATVFYYPRRNHWIDIDPLGHKPPVNYLCRQRYNSIKLRSTMNNTQRLLGFDGQEPSSLTLLPPPLLYCPRLHSFIIRYIHSMFLVNLSTYCTYSTLHVHVPWIFEGLWDCPSFVQQVFLNYFWIYKLSFNDVTDSNMRVWV